MVKAELICAKQPCLSMQAPRPPPAPLQAEGSSPASGLALSMSDYKQRTTAEMPTKP